MSNIGTYPTPSAPDNGVKDGISIVPVYNEAILDNNFVYTIHNIYTYVDGVLKDSITKTVLIDYLFKFTFNLNKLGLYLKDILCGNQKVPYIINNYDRDNFEIYIDVLSSFDIEFHFTSTPTQLKPQIEIEPNSPSCNERNFNSTKYYTMIGYTISDMQYTNIIEHGIILKYAFGDIKSVSDIYSITLEEVESNPDACRKLVASINKPRFFWSLNYPSKANSYKIPIAFRAYAILEDPDTKEQITVYSSNPCIIEHIEHFN